MDGVTHHQPEPDPVTEKLVLSFIDLIHERKLAGRRELAATMETIAAWLSERTGLTVQPYHVQTLTATLREAGIITVASVFRTRTTRLNTPWARKPFGIRWTFYSFEASQP